MDEVIAKPLKDKLIKQILEEKVIRAGP